MSDLSSDPGCEVSGLPPKRTTAWMLRAMADREEAESYSKAQFAKILREAADALDLLEQKK